jgi:3-hydroxyisobutyrate dehydrogenase
MSASGMMGIVGLGQIGGGMASRLAAQKIDVMGFDIAEPACARAAAAGVVIADSLQSLAARCDVIFTSLSSTKAIEQVYLGPDGLAASARPGQLTLECSTVAPDFAKRVTAAMIEAGAAALETSVIGQDREALAGKLFFVVAGEAASVDRAEPFLALLGHGHVHIGPSGTAAAAKLINNAIGAVTLCAIAESIALAEDLGIDPEAFVRLVDEGKGAGYSVVFARHASHMVNWRHSTRPPGPISLKDAQGLMALMGERQAVLPFLAESARLYEALLPNATHPQAEMLAEHSQKQLATRSGDHA